MLEVAATYERLEFPDTEHTLPTPTIHARCCARLRAGSVSPTATWVPFHRKAGLARAPHQPRKFEGGRKHAGLSALHWGMRTWRRIRSAGISIAGHALALGALAVLGQQPSPEPTPRESELSAVELVEVTVREDTADAPLRVEGTLKRGEERDPVVEPETQPLEHRRRRKVQARARAVNDVPETTRGASVFESTDGSPNVRVPVSPLAAENTSGHSPGLDQGLEESQPAQPSSARLDSLSEQGPPLSSERVVGGRAEDAYAGYGASIVRAVVAEIDRVPIGGIHADDSIQLVLEVLPNGRLASVGRRRFEVARVEETTLGRLLQWQVLRRVAQASKRFPPHPAGFTKARFVVDVTVRFRGVS